MEIAIRITQKGGLLESMRPAEVVRKNLVAAMHEATQYGSRRIKIRTPKGVSEQLFKSVHPEVHPAQQQVVGLIGTPQKYGAVIEWGRKPGAGKPPRGALLRWVEFRFGVSGKDAERAEFFVRRKIAKKGFEGAHMFEDTIAEDWPQFVTIFDRYGFQISQELGG